MKTPAVAVVGTGVMGSGIAQCLATHGFTTWGYDPSPEQRARAARAVEEGRYGLARAVSRGKLTEADAEATRSRLSFTESLEEAVDGVGLVIECAPEDLALKIQVFRTLDACAPAGAVLASNASGLPIVALAASTERPESVLGWHWASPPPIMRMAEIVVTDRTDDAAVELVTGVAAASGKDPVVVRENTHVWGFAANRVIAAMVREAQRVVDEGLVSEDGLDRLLTGGWGWPVGPFAMRKGAAEGWGDGWESSITETITLH